jgi:hypothetical protein
MKVIKFFSLPLICLTIFFVSNKQQPVLSLKAYLEKNYTNKGHNFREPQSLRRIKKIIIPENQSYLLDTNLLVGELIINGELRCKEDTSTPVEIKAKTIMVHGTLQCGTSSEPHLSELTIKLEKDTSLEYDDPKNRGLMVMNGGVLMLHGSKKKSGYLKLIQTAEPGDTQIFLSGSLLTSKRKWSVGDRIAIAPTSYDYNEAEDFLIQSINGNIITLDRPVVYRHWGKLDTYATKSGQNYQLDQRAEVINLTRNIKIESDESSISISDGSEVGAEIGAHVMIMPTGSSYISAVEFNRMGQAGVMARYPFHWHIVGDVSGQYIKDSSIHNSFQRCITVHRSNNAVVKNNSCYDIKGHAIFLEDGTEQNNIIENNIGIKIKHPHHAKRLLASDINPDYSSSSQWSPTGSDPDRAPTTAAFWISHPNNIVKNNIAAGSVGAGFWMAFEDSVEEYDGTVLRPKKENTLEFTDNTAHSNLVGFTWSAAADGENAGNPNNPNDKKIVRVQYQPEDEPEFVNLKHYKNSLAGVYTNAVGSKFINNVSADNGYHYFITYNQKIENSVIIGRSHNHSAHEQNLLSSKLNTPYLPTYSNDRREQKGVILYDGPVSLKNVAFVNYPKNEVLHTYNNQTKVVTPLPFGMNFGFENFMNRTEGLSFHPAPFRKIKVDHGSREHAFWLRDMDGTLSGIEGGSLILGKSSMSVTDEDECVDGGEKFKNLILCPASKVETKLHINGSEGYYQLYGSIFEQSISTTQAFIMRTSQGRYSEPMIYWPNIFRYSPSNSNFQTLGSSGRTKIGLPNREDIDMELLIKTISPRVRLSSTEESPKVPLVKVVGNGYNCEMVKTDEYSEDIIQVDSVQDVRDSNSSAYFSSGNDLYFRLIPYKNHHFHPEAWNEEDVHYASGQYRILCEGPTENYIHGKITEAEFYGSLANITGGTISGFACMYGRHSKINVDLIFADSNLSNQVVFDNVKADIIPDPDDAFNCGMQGSSPNTKGYRFQFNINAQAAYQFRGKKILVRGLSNVDGIDDGLLERSGELSVPAPAVGNNHTKRRR